MALTDNSTGGRVIKEGFVPFKITLTDTCNVGDLIGYDALTNQVWVRADAADKIFAECVAGEQCRASGTEITVYREAIIGGIEADAAGDSVYLSDTAGAYIAAPVGSFQQWVGSATSTTEMRVAPNKDPKVAYQLTGLGYAGYFRTEVDADEETPEPHFGGIRTDVKTIASTASISSDTYGLYVFFQLLEDVTGTMSMIRLEDGCANGCSPESFIHFLGAGADGGPDYFFKISGPAVPSGGAWSRTGTTKSSASAGWLKLDLGGVDKYINLWTS